MAAVNNDIIQPKELLPLLPLRQNINTTQPITAEDWVAASEDYRALKKFKAEHGGAVVTSAVLLDHGTRKAAIKQAGNNDDLTQSIINQMAATNQAYPQLSPARAGQLDEIVDKLSTLANQITENATAILNRIQEVEAKVSQIDQIDAKLTLVEAKVSQIDQIGAKLTLVEAKVDRARLCQANERACRAGDATRSLSPLPSVTAANLGLYPQQRGVYFPASVEQANALTLQQLIALEEFYGVRFEGNPEKFKDYVRLG